MTFPAKLLVTLISLLLYQVVGNTAAEYIMVFSLIAFIGIPHGATDHTLYGYILPHQSSKERNITFFGYYLVVMAVYTGLWFLSPFLSFVVFLLMSAYHFGETQLAYLGNNRFSKWSAVFNGLVFLMILLLPHQTEVGSYVVPYLIDEASYQDRKS
ncbi:MAG: Brp/Blh family beta-carotene 15,15'-dioxygenase, partial [Cyclobacteriaceae bacterium]